MKPFIADYNSSSSLPLYIQLYRHIKSAIIQGDTRAGDRLPSLRRMAEDSGLSLTTVGRAYDQLLTEGYVTSRPQSGYYANDIPGRPTEPGPAPKLTFDLSDQRFYDSPYMYDLATFDFVRWKKCMSRVFNEYPELLLSESDIQGERALRYEIARYLYRSRGVTTDPDRIVIGAGSQQLTFHLCRILRRLGINLLCMEEPGYEPINKIFTDDGFSILKIPGTDEGLTIEKLPVNIRSAVYVSPANRFPSGDVMPIATRYRLLEWVKENDSIILEDDYDSELRYAGKPVPALQGLDKTGRVVYFGSFTATLFPAVKISYMILPETLARIFYTIMSDYTQTCSKTDQLTLALFMEDGYYYTNIRKIRSLYARKISLAISAFSAYAHGKIRPANPKAGKNMVIRVDSHLDVETLTGRAKDLGIRLAPLAISVGTKAEKTFIFYYNQIPSEKMVPVIRKLIEAWGMH